MGDNNNQDVTVLPKELFVQANQEEEEDIWTYTFRNTNDQLVATWAEAHNLTNQEGHWWKNERLVVARGNNLERGVIHFHHDLPMERTSCSLSQTLLMEKKKGKLRRSWMQPGRAKARNSITSSNGRASWIVTTHGNLTTCQPQMQSAISIGNTQKQKEPLLKYIRPPLRLRMTTHLTFAPSSPTNPQPCLLIAPLLKLVLNVLWNEDTFHLIPPL